jgi:hypothetical protein
MPGGSCGRRALSRATFGLHCVPPPGIVVDAWRGLLTHILRKSDVKRNPSPAKLLPAQELWVSHRLYGLAAVKEDAR